VYEKLRTPGMVRGIEGARSSSTGEAATNSSREAPGPLADQGRASSRETLSNTRPILSSGVVARTWNWVVEEARRRSVWPPETSKARNGNWGVFEGQVRMGVRACACFCAIVNSLFLRIEHKGEVVYHVVYADQRLVKSCSKCLGSAGTNPKTACHAYVVCFQSSFQRHALSNDAKNSYLVRV
jgi:hypothetical protein